MSENTVNFNAKFHNNGRQGRPWIYSFQNLKLLFDKWCVTLFRVHELEAIRDAKDLQQEKGLKLSDASS